MVPKVAGTGRSFKGAGLYYLHDKKALTRDRVAFTHTENLPTLDPDKAIKCMAWTALRQNELKARAGGSTRGRKMTSPVYCYSLSWAPGEEPNYDDMVRAAKETLKELGLDKHETLFVGHRDEPHPHIHVIVNRVNPETGIAATLSKDFLTLSSWAQRFEERQGTIRCEKRVENNELREIGKFVKDRDSQTEAEFRRWQQDRRETRRHKREQQNAILEDRHERDHDKLFAERDRKIEAKRKQVHDATRGEWRSIYRTQYEQKKNLESAQRTAWGRLRFFLRTYGAEFKGTDKAGRKEILKGALAALIGSKRQFAELERRQLAARKAQGDQIKAKIDNLTRGIKEEHARKLIELRNQHGKERIELNKQQAKERDAHVAEKREGRDKKEFIEERDKKRRAELQVTKSDITKRPDIKPEVKSKLRAHFDKVKGQQAKAEDRREPGKARGKGLSEEFRKATDEIAKDRKGEFKNNANDISKDTGRDRSISRKPPGPKKD
jgi:hypothetical protein